jgi:hypothetical protein
MYTSMQIYNAHTHTHTGLEHAESLNQVCRGRVEALKLLRNELRSEADRRLGSSVKTQASDSAGVVVKQETRDEQPLKRKREEV